MGNSDIYLSEPEVYQLAGNVINSICRDLNETIYKKMGGNYLLLGEKVNHLMPLLKYSIIYQNHQVIRLF